MGNILRLVRLNPRPRKTLSEASPCGMVLREPMSEFKFACPVCGQHITADSKTSGLQLDCPTCYQKIIVPQAPASDASGLILSASQVGKPRPVPTDTSETVPLPPRRMSFVSYAFWMLLITAAAASFFLFRGRIINLVRSHSESESKAKLKKTVTNSYPIPTKFGWTMNLNSMVIPEKRASGGIRGVGFLCEHATLQGGNLTLRQGKASPDLGITIYLFAREGEELSGKTVQVGPDRLPPIPKIVLRWKDEQDQTRKQDFTSGYALKMIFGQPMDARMPGKLFLAFPDEAKSFVAGTFEAEIRKAPPPKPRAASN